MARGRSQSWACRDCKAEFSVQGSVPKFCCSCGSDNIGRAPSYELMVNFETKRGELENVCYQLNEMYDKYTDLKGKYDAIMSYWKQQRRRGYISNEEYNELAGMFVGYAGAEGGDDG